MALALFLGAFGAAIGAAAATGRLATPERWEYSQIAENILSGRGPVYDYLGAEYHFYGPPLYPALLAALLRVTSDGETVMVVLQALLFGLTCLAAYGIGRRLFGFREALLGACLVALHPGALVYIGKLHSQTLDVFLILLNVLVFVSLPASAPIGLWLAAGVSAGLAALSRGTRMPFYAVWAVWFLLTQRRQLGRALQIVGALAVGGLLAFSPILARGYQVYGTLVPLRTDTGVNLWYGNHPGATGTSYTFDSVPMPVIGRLTDRQREQIVGMSELEHNVFFSREAMAFIRSNPGGAGVLWARKILYYWWFSPHAGLHYPAGWLAIYKIYYGLVLGFAALGLAIGLRSSRSASRDGSVLFVLMAFSVSLTQALFYVEGRHRWQLEPLMLIVAAVGILAVVDAKPRISRLGTPWRPRGA